MGRSVQKKILCIILAFAVAISTIVSSGGTLFASEVLGIQEESGGSTESLAEHSETAFEENEVMPESSEPVFEDGEAFPESEPVSEGGEVLPESGAASGDSGSVSENSESATGDSGIVPESEPVSEGGEVLPEGGAAFGDSGSASESSESASGDVGAVSENKDSVPEAVALLSAIGRASHHLMEVYWNPDDLNETSGTGVIIKFGGSDANSGATAKKPVLSIEAAFQRAAANAVVYNMNNCSYNLGSGQATVDGNQGGGFYNITVKRHGDHTGNIFQVANGTLRIDNLTLDGSNSMDDRMITIADGGVLQIGDSVGAVGNSFCFVQGDAGAIELVGKPEAGTVYRVQFAAGYFAKTPVITEDGSELLLVDAAAAGINPESYFSIQKLPSGWAVFAKDNQLWARKVVQKPDEPDEPDAPDEPDKPDKPEVYTGIWLDGKSGNDANSGRTSNESVRTWQRAYELYQDKMNGNGTIYIKGTVAVGAGSSLNIQSASIKRGGSFKGTLFQVDKGGSLTIGNGISIQKLEYDPQKDEYYAVVCAGDLEISAASSVEERILLTNRTKPMVLNGSGSNTYVIQAGGDYENGDLIVKNGVYSHVEIVPGEFCLKEDGNDYRLFIPPIIFINGKDGNDGYDGLTPQTAVRTLTKAVEIGYRHESGNLAVLGGPAEIKDGKTETLPEGMQIFNCPPYTGALLETGNGTLLIKGSVLGDITAKGGETYVAGSGADVEGDITVSGDASFTQQDGEITGKIIMNSSGAKAVKSGGIVDGIISIYSGQFTMRGGKILETGSSAASGIVLESGGSGSLLLQDGELSECKTAIHAKSGTVTMEGGAITNSKKNSIVLEGNAAMTIKGGTITGGSAGHSIVLEENAAMTIKGGTITGGSAGHSIEVSGKLALTGEAAIDGVIFLKNSANPLELIPGASAAAGNKNYQLGFDAGYAEMGTTALAVKGSVASPATLEQFSLWDGSSKLLELREKENEGQDAGCLYLHVQKPEEGVYLDGEAGDDGRSGKNPSEAVKTFERAKELLEKYHKEEGKEYDIFICGQVTITDKQTWSLSKEEFGWNPIVMRYVDYTGRMASVTSNGKLELKDIVLDGNERVEGSGSILYFSSGTTGVVQDGTIIQNNNSVGSGGGIYNRGTVTINGGSIENNSAASGGGIYNNGTVTISGGSIGNNSATSGGGIYNSSGAVSISGGSIGNNNSTNYGGGIYNHRGTLTINGGSIENNSANIGGGIYNDDEYGKVNISGGSIENNSAGSGGGISNDYGTVTISGGKIENNNANASGGGVYNHGTVIMEEGIISGNYAPKGGGIYNYCHGIMTLKGGTIESNRAEDGGGIWNNRQLAIDGGIIRNNRAVNGGGIYSENYTYPFINEPSKIDLNGGALEENYAETGSGIYINDYKVYMASQSMDISFGNTVLGAQQLIAVMNGSYLSLPSAPTNPSVRFGLQMDPASASSGKVVVAPDGSNVSNASQYLRNFAIGDGSGYSLVKSGNNIVLGQAFFIDGEGGSDSNNGRTPESAFKTVNYALSQLGGEAGTIYVCGKITVAAGEDETWTMAEGQSLTRYDGLAVNGISSPPFKGDMIEVEEGAKLAISGGAVYGALGENFTAGNGYIMLQKGILNVSADVSFEHGTVYLKDGKVIHVTGSSDRLLMEIEKENPHEGDIIGQYESDAASDIGNFELSDRMAGYSLKKAGDTVQLEKSKEVYVDGVHGADANSGEDPEHALATVKAAYRKLSDGGGMIYIVDTVALQGSTVLMPKKYTDDVTDAADTEKEVNSSGSITIIRYKKNTHPLFWVPAGKTFTLSGMLLDGGNAAANPSPLILVERGGNLTLNANTVLRNNHSTGSREAVDIDGTKTFFAGMGGAVYSEGTVNIADCRFTGNTASQGAAVYQAGTLNIRSAYADLDGEEVYFAENRYINILEPLAEDAVIQLDMAPSDTAEGRKIAVFSNRAYSTEGVIAESSHFLLNPETTNRALAAEGADTLVLAAEFDMELMGTEFFEKAGGTVTVTAVPKNAEAGAVSVEAVNGSGEPVACTVTDYNRYKSISIPVEKAGTGTGGKSIGKVTLKFTYKNGIRVEKTITVSAYEVSYAEGRDSLIAEPAEGGESGVHTDQAYLTIYNSADAERTFYTGDSLAISYEDGAEVKIDNDRVSRDMENAMSCFGVEIEEESVEIPAGGERRIRIDFYNGDRLTESKKGNITLEGAVFASGEKEIWKNIDISFATKVPSEVLVRVEKDDAAYAGAEVTLENTAAQKTIELSMVSDAEQWQYRAEGADEGEYRLYVDGMDTGKLIAVTSGRIIRQEIKLYTVTYELHGGSFEDGRAAQDVYVAGVGLKTLPTPKRSVLRFAGWYADKDFSGNPIGQIGASESRPYTLYAAWSITAELQDAQLPQQEYFEPFGSSLTIPAEIKGIEPARVAVQIFRTDASGNQTELAAQCTDSGIYKMITLPVDEASIGTITLAFSERSETLQRTETRAARQEKAADEQEAAEVTKQIVLSAYEAAYADGKNCLTASAQEDGKSDIHTERAEIRIYNGSLEERSFRPGRWEASYTEEPDRSVQILNRRVSKDMSADDAMRYFGMELTPEKADIPAGGVQTLEAVFFNGDNISESKTGTIVLTGAKLGDASADIPLSFETQPITRVRVRLQMNDMYYNGRNVELQDAVGNAIKMENTQEQKDKKVHTVLNWLSGQEEQNWNYMLTGLEAGRYQIFVDGMDTERSVLVQTGKTEKEVIRLFGITYELYEGSLPLHAPDSYIEGVGVQLENPSRKDDAFLGWYLTEDYRGEPLTGISRTMSGRVHLYAKWESIADGQPVAGGRPPKTSDRNKFIFEAAFVGGTLYLSKMFLQMNADDGMDDEKKERLVRKIIAKAKGKGLAARLGALAKVTVVLMFYYTLGMNDETRAMKKLA